MPSLFTNYRTPLYTPMPDKEWDSLREEIRANRKDIDKELIGYALAFMSKVPALAPLVPVLSREIDITPNTNLDETINLFREVLRNLNYSELVVSKDFQTNEVESKDFKSQLEDSINRNSMENVSDTPDFILAEYLQSCLSNFNKATNSRNKLATSNLTENKS